MTMKMMISTSSTSIMGVMLMSALGPPLPPTAIPIEITPYKDFLLLPGRRRSGRWIGLICRLPLLGEQAQLVYADGPKIIHQLDYAIVFRAIVRLDEYSLIGGALFQEFLHSLRHVRRFHLGNVQVSFAIAGNRADD